MALNEKRRIVPLGAIYFASLALVFLGERILSSVDAARYVATGLGVVGLVASTALRLAGARSQDPERRGAERVLGFLSLGGLAGVAIYFLTTDLARNALGIAAMSPDKRARVDALLSAGWMGVLVLSALPLLLGEIAYSPMRRAERIEVRRVRSAVRSGATLAIAAIYCALFTFAAGELDLKLDYSYFRTSKPSESTKAIAGSVSEPVEIAAFFPQLNDVGAEVEGYLRDVVHDAPNVKLAFHDRLLEPQTAKDKKVTTDGVIVLTRGASREAVTIGADMKTAGSKLKTLDQDFQKAFLKVMREAHVAYLTVGHGEMAETGGEKLDGRTSKNFKKILESQNYVVKDLGLTQGLGADVPGDATLVVVLGPSQALLPEEVASLGRFADKGGHLLLALDPDGKVDLSPLAALTGLTWSPTRLANDHMYIKHAHNASDKAIIVANHYSSHASVSTLSRNSSREFVVFVRASSLDKAAGATEKIDFAVKSLPDTFNDTKDDYEFGGDDKRSSYNLAAAVSKPGTGEAKGKEASEMRAFVVADADCFSDAVLANEANLVFALDAVRWLGGEESFAGAIASNEDVRIEHTKAKDVIWFYATIFGLPGMVLAFGLWRTRRVRRAAPRRDAAEPAPQPKPKRKPRQAARPAPPREEEKSP